MPQVQVQDVRVETVQKGRNSYQKATVVYTDGKGQQKEKNVMSFSNPAVFTTVKDLKSGTYLDITYAKDDPYFNWATATIVTQEAPAKTATAATGGKVLGSQYETREERQLRQLHIVRQSSLANAIEYYKHQAFTESNITVDEVLAVAQAFVDFVYNNDDVETLDSDHEDVPY